MNVYFAHRRVLDEHEANTLLSAASVALNNCGLNWPVFIPVHDALRDGFWGHACLGHRSVSFRTDSLHVSWPPAHLQTLEGQLQVFGQQLLPHNPAAAAACFAAVQQPNWLSEADTGGGTSGCAGSSCGGGGEAREEHQVRWSAGTSYVLPNPNEASTLNAFLVSAPGTCCNTRCDTHGVPAATSSHLFNVQRAIQVTMPVLVLVLVQTKY